MLLKSLRFLSRTDKPEDTRSKTSFQVLSDLHLEVNQQYPAFTIPAHAPYLILAGDIGRLIDYDKYLSFLQRHVELGYKRIFLVLGNHEFYNTSFTEGIVLARKLEQEPALSGRVICLNRDRYDIPDSQLTILGCSLWSHVPDKVRDLVRARVQDFTHINGWTLDGHNAAHEEDAVWLREQVHLLQNDKNAGSKREIVIITHHAPTLKKTSPPQHEGGALSPAFATDLLGHGSWKGVKLWCFGHTHFTTDFVKRGVRVVSNQRGYVLPWTKAQTKEDFDVDKVVWV